MRVENWSKYCKLASCNLKFNLLCYINRIFTFAALQKNFPITEVIEEEESSPTNSGSEFDDAAEREYEKNLMTRRKSLQINTHNSKASSKFEATIRSFATEDIHLKLRHSILSFWEKHKYTYPELYEVAKIVFAVPTTQATVERLLSHMRFLLSYSSRSFKPDVINEMLVIKSNISTFENL